MMGLCILIATTILGSAGWWLGDHFGFGLMTTYLLSSVGSLAGVYAGWRVHRDYLS